MVDRGGVTDASLDAFFQSVSEITSSYDKQRVLQRVVDRLSATRGLGSHDEHRALAALVRSEVRR